MREHLQGRGKLPSRGAAIGCCSSPSLSAAWPEPTATRPAADAKGTPRYRFDGNTVLDLARRTAGSAFVPKRLDNPALQQLTYDQYRDIRFKPEAAHLAQRTGAVPGRAVARGLPVPDAGRRLGRRRRPGARHRAGDPTTFVLGGTVAKQLANQTLPLSGFRVRTRLNSRSVWDEFMVFQGASYFRAVRARHALRTVGARPGDSHGASGRRRISGVHALLDRAAAAQCRGDRRARVARQPVDHRRLSLLGHAGHRNRDGRRRHAVPARRRSTTSASRR